jgi:hypothetical protein
MIHLLRFKNTLIAYNGVDIVKGGVEEVAPLPLQMLRYQRSRIFGFWWGSCVSHLQLQE